MMPYIPTIYSHSSAFPSICLAFSTLSQSKSNSRILFHSHVRTTCLHDDQRRLNKRTAFDLYFKPTPRIQCYQSTFLPRTLKQTESRRCDPGHFILFPLFILSNIFVSSSLNKALKCTYFILNIPVSEALRQDYVIIKDGF